VKTRRCNAGVSFQARATPFYGMGVTMGPGRCSFRVYAFHRYSVRSPNACAVTHTTRRIAAVLTMRTDTAVRHILRQLVKLLAIHVNQIAMVAAFEE
jgi:hypothetical protein